MAATTTAKTEPEQPADVETPPAVGDLIVQRDGEGNPVRVGLLVGEGRTPNLEHRDAEGRSFPESPEPVIAWFLTETPSPYGGPISRLS